MYSCVFSCVYVVHFRWLFDIITYWGHNNSHTWPIYPHSWSNRSYIPTWELCLAFWTRIFWNCFIKMPKSRRKKKLKEKDFQKVKFKVGKKIQPAQNATDTSFKSRAIFIPSQLSQTTEPTNQRNQNLKVPNNELISLNSELRSLKTYLSL